MEALKFDDGVINLEVNGTGRIFSFNPTNSKLYEGFYELLNETPKKLNEVADKAKALADTKLSEEEKQVAEIKLYADMDTILREGFDNAFGAGKSDALFGEQSVCSFGSNGEFIFYNALMALLPFFEKEAKKRKQKIKKVAAQYKQ